MNWKAEPISWSEPQAVTWFEYVWVEADYYGRRMDGSESKLRGFWRMFRKCLPGFDINRDEDVSFYGFQFFAFPSRDCMELEFWTLFLEVTHTKHQKKLIWDLQRGPQ